MTDGIRVERQSSAVVLTVDRPEARNAMTAAMRSSLVSIVEDLADDRDLRSVFLRGAGGRSFVSGGDIAEFARSSIDDFRAMTDETHRLLAALDDLRVPTVAVVEGAAMGAGFMLALACDLCICTPDARFAIPVAKLGNCLSPPELHRLIAAFGPKRTARLLLGAAVLDADAAAAWGLVSETVDPERLEDRIEELRRQFDAQAPLSMQATKESIHRVVAGLQLGPDLMEQVWSSRDFREGIASFVEHRPPKWTGQ